MADQANVFETVPPAGTETIAVSPANDPISDKLKTIVGPDGKPKYANPLLAIDALAASQAHIQTLEAERAQERAEIERLREVERNARSLEEIAERLKNTNAPEEKATPNAVVDANTINELVKNALDNRDRQSTARANIKRVSDVLTEKYKDKVEEVLATKARELNTTPKALGELASQNPQLVLQLFGHTATPAPSPTNTSISSPQTNVNGEPVKKPDYSLISGTGATDKNRKELMAQIKADVYKKLDVTTS